jgi:GNAT superfamily N-acetyltransferase
MKPGPASENVLVRRATVDDLPVVVGLFALDDDGNREDSAPERELEPCYVEALCAIDGDPNNAFLVAEDVSGRVVGTFQLTVIQYVAYRGGRVAQIENVLVSPDQRGQGIGEAMMRWAIDEARRRGCFRVQLTSNRRRTRAHAFYERLGFVPSHVGMKLVL